MNGPPREKRRVDLDVIEALIAKHPDGIGRAALESAYAESSGRAIPWRTLLRRLGQLEREQRIVIAGSGKSTLYRPGPALLTDEDRGAEAGYVDISEASRRIRAVVRRPLGERHPVGYDTSLLDDYKPGVTWYLPEETRQHLHDIGRTAEAQQPAGTYARDIYSRLLIDLAWASSQLEGNTYTRLDTQLLLEFGQTAEGKQAEETLMILNHKAAIELLVEQADLIGLNGYTVCNLHAAVSEGLMENPADEGTLRKGPVAIGQSTYVPLAIPQKIEELFHLLLAKAEAIPDPIEQSFFLLIHLPYLQPFGDINKRTSRLAANIPLIKANLCPLSFVGVPVRAYVEGILGLYELRKIELIRDVFVAAYERSCAQYRVVKDSVPPPDRLRTRYRGELRDTVKAIVLDGLPPRAKSVRRVITDMPIEKDDYDAFVECALSLIAALHEGAIGRYGLRPSQFASWRENYSPAGRHDDGSGAPATSRLPP